MRRGPYFKYLFDPNVPVPPSTLRRWNNGIVNNEVEAVEENADHQQIEDSDSDQDSPNSSGRSSPPISEMELSASSGRSSPHSNREVYSSGSEISLQSRDMSVSDVSDHDSEDMQDHGDLNGDRESQSSCSGNGDSDRNNDSDVRSNSSGDSDEDNNSDSGMNDDSDLSDGNSDASNHDPPVYDSDDGDDIPALNARVPLFEGCRITLEESRLLIMSFSLRFGLSDLAIDNLLKLINCHLPLDQYQSLYMFKKYIPAPPLINMEFLCSEENCQRLLRFENGVNNVLCECGAESDQKTLKKGGHYFLTLPLKPQLLSLFENRDVCQSLRWESENESDVISGRVYQAGVNQGLIEKNCDISLQFNTDGVQVFKSSSIQIWPIQVAVNELPFRIRNENIMLCGLWYGQGKPNMNSFLQPFVNELNDLHLNGILVPSEPPRLLKVHSILCSVDSMARAPLQNLKTFRGKYGCAFCLHPGEEHVVGIRGGKTRLYRGGLHQLRRAHQHREDVDSILQGIVASPIRGIKGPSVLLTLNMFDIADSFVPDYLHCVLLGVVKTMFKFWTLGRNKNKDFYFGNKAKLDEIDSVLLSIKPPSEITKTPQSIHKIKLWKGHEWKNFLLYYSIPCLKKINFPSKYLQHWFLLVYGGNCFLSDLVTPEKFEKGKAALFKFVLTIEEVYGTHELWKYNTHLLLHIPRSVKNYGALWASSTFPFEHYNGTLGKMFRSSQAVPLQICKNYVRLQGVKEELNNRAVDNRIPDCMKKTLVSLVCGKRSKHALRIDRDFVLMGAARFGVLMLVQQNLVENLINAPVENTNVQFYLKFMYKNVKHHVENCPVLEKRINCVVQLGNGDFISISHAIKIRSIEENPRSFVVILGSKLRPTNDVLVQDRALNISSNSFLTTVVKSNECVAIFPQMIARKCLLTFYPGNPLKYCCYPLVNLVERD